MRVHDLTPVTKETDQVAAAKCYRLNRSIAFARCVVMSGPQRQVAAIAVGTFMLSSNSAREPDITKFAGVQTP